MTQEPVTLEELVELSGRSLAEISGELLDLQMQGKLGLADGRAGITEFRRTYYYDEKFSNRGITY